MANTETRSALILQACLDAVQTGAETVETVLSRYPELEDELRPQLENAVWLMAHRSVLDPDPTFVRRSRQRLMARISAQQRQVAAAPSWKTTLLSVFRMPPVVLRAAVALLVVVVLLMGTDRVVETTESAIPGDPGYTVKRTVEDLTLAVSNDPGQQIVLYLEYSQRRLSEVNALVDKSRYNDATETLDEFQTQVKKAVTSLDAVRDEDTVHKELLAMTIQEKLSDHSRQLSILLPRVPDAARPAVTRALNVSASGVEIASSALKRLMTIRTPQPGELPSTPTVDSLVATSLAPTATQGTIYQVYSTPTEEFRQIFSSTEAPPPPLPPRQVQPTTHVIIPTPGPTATPLPTLPPDEEFTPVPTDTGAPSVQPITSDVPPTTGSETTQTP